MIKRPDNQKGFTLIELIITLVIVGVLSAVAGMGLVQVVNGYLLTKESATLSQKAQLAMARMVRELTSISTIGAGASTTITYTAVTGDGVTETHTISLDEPNNLVKLNDDTLVDDVNDLVFTYVYLDADGTETTEDTWSESADKTWAGIEITLTLDMSGTLHPFHARVYARNYNRY